MSRVSSMKSSILFYGVWYGGGEEGEGEGQQMMAVEHNTGSFPPF